MNLFLKPSVKVGAQSVPGVEEEWRYLNTAHAGQRRWLTASKLLSIRKRMWDYATCYVPTQLKKQHTKLSTARNFLLQGVRTAALK